MLIETLTKLPRIKGETASEFSFRVELELKKQNFLFRKEVTVPNRGDGRKGRIDIVANKENIIYALELDRIFARKKSIYKLQHYPCDYRLVVMREKNIVQEVPII